VVPNSSILATWMAAFEAAWALSSGAAEVVGQGDSSRVEISPAFSLAMPTQKRPRVKASLVITSLRICPHVAEPGCALSLAAA